VTRLVVIACLLLACGGTDDTCPDGASVVDVPRGGWCCSLSDGTMHGPLDMVGDNGDWQSGYMDRGNPCGHWLFSSGEEYDLEPCGWSSQ